MLVIRLQRLGRTGEPTYRLIVQDSRRHPSSENLVARLGSYNPHTKDLTVDETLIQKYLDDGAQPSDRVVKILTEAKVKIKFPKWVKDVRKDQQRKIKNADKLRRNQPKEEAADEPKEAKPEAEAKDQPAEEAKA